MDVMEGSTIIDTSEQLPTIITQGQAKELNIKLILQHIH